MRSGGQMKKLWLLLFHLTYNIMIKKKIKLTNKDWKKINYIWIKWSKNIVEKRRKKSCWRIKKIEKDFWQLRWNFEKKYLIKIIGYLLRLQSIFSSYSFELINICLLADIILLLYLFLVLFLNAKTIGYKSFILFFSPIGMIFLNSILLRKKNSERFGNRCQVKK